MHMGKQAKDGRVLLEEYKLCSSCTRMICLNRERYLKVYVPNVEGIAYRHEECPPLKFFQNQLG